MKRHTPLYSARPVSIRLETGLCKALEAWAKREGRTRANLIVQLLRDAVRLEGKAK